MLELLIVIGRVLALGLRGDRELVLENLALRQQLMAMNGRPNASPPAARPVVLDRPTASLEELAEGGGLGTTRHRCAMASRLAPPPMGPTVETPSERPSTNRVSQACSVLPLPAVLRTQYADCAMTMALV